MSAALKSHPGTSAVIAAITSPNGVDCTPSTVLSLRTLLGLPSPLQAAATDTHRSDDKKPAQTPKPLASTSRTIRSQTPAPQRAGKENAIGRSLDQKAALSLATEVVNLGLRHISAPKLDKAQKNAPANETMPENGPPQLAQCVIAAFEFLKKYAPDPAATAAKSTSAPLLPPLQWETGQSTFVSKLIGASIYALAYREVVHLRQRLDTILDQKPLTASRASLLPKLLDFQVKTIPPHLETLVINYQTSVVRLLSHQPELHNPSSARTKASPVDRLMFECPTSPLSLLVSQMGKLHKADQERREKLLRQIENFAQILLSSCPSISSAEDERYSDPRLKKATARSARPKKAAADITATATEEMNPEIAFRIQTLAFEARAMVIKLRAPSDRPLPADSVLSTVSVFNKSLATYVRRTLPTSIRRYQLAADSYTRLISIIGGQDQIASLEKLDWNKMAAIYLSLSSLASTVPKGGADDAALAWALKAKKEGKPGKPAMAAQSSSEAKTVESLLRVASLLLAQSKASLPSDLNEIMAAISALEGEMSLRTGELDSILGEVVVLRKAAVRIIRDGLDRPLENGTPVGARTVSATARFYKRYLSFKLGSKKGDSKPKSEDPNSDGFALAKGFVDAVFFAVKAVLSFGAETQWETVHSFLTEALWIVRHGLSEEDKDDCLVTCSGLYTAVATASKELKQQQTEPNSRLVPVSILGFHYATEILAGCPVKVQARGAYAPKLLALARKWREMNNFTECRKNTELAIEWLLLNEAVSQLLIERASRVGLLNVFDSDDLVTLRSALKLRVGLGGETLDFETLQTPVRGIVLELQLSLLGEIELRGIPMPGPIPLNSAISTTAANLLTVYSAQYPIRQCRAGAAVLRLSGSIPAELVDKAILLIKESQLSSPKFDIVLAGEDKDMCILSEHVYAEALCGISLSGSDGVNNSLLLRAVERWKRLSAQVLHDKVIADELTKSIPVFTTIFDYAFSNRLNSLATAISEVASAAAKARGSASLQIEWAVRVARVYSRTGMMRSASSALSRVAHLVEVGSCLEEGAEARTHYYLAQAECLRLSGKADEGAEMLKRISIGADTPGRTVCGDKGISELIASQSRNSASRLRYTRAFGEYCRQIASSTKLVSLESAIGYARRAILVEQRAWAAAEQRAGSDGSSVANTGPIFWPLMTPLIESYLLTADLFIRAGICGDTIYWLDQALSILRAAGSARWEAAVLVRKAEVLKEAGKMGKNEDGTQGCLLKAAKLLQQLQASAERNGRVETDMQQLEVEVRFWILRAEIESDETSWAEAERLAADLIRICKREDGSEELAEQIEGLKISDKPARGRRVRRVQSPKSKGAEGVARSWVHSIPSKVKCQMALFLLDQDEPDLTEIRKLMEGAIAEQEEATTSIDTSADPFLLSHRLMKARFCFVDALQALSVDMRYSVLAESGVVFPGIQRWESPTAGEGSSQRGTRKRSGRAALVLNEPSFVASLRSARDSAAELQRMVIDQGGENDEMDWIGLADVHSACATVVQTSVLLSAVGANGEESEQVPRAVMGAAASLAAVANVTARRERCAARAEKRLGLIGREGVYEWPTAKGLERPKGSGEGPSGELEPHEGGVEIEPEIRQRPARRAAQRPASKAASRAKPVHKARTARPQICVPESVLPEQRDIRAELVDKIPADWSVRSLALSPDGNELFVAHFDRGRDPFVLRLPLGRSGEGGHEEDQDEEEPENYTFADGKAELDEIVDLSNFSAHNVPLAGVKGGKTQWWSEREALDRRLAGVLRNIERVWFGGFRGVLVPDFGCRMDGDGKPWAKFVRKMSELVGKYVPGVSADEVRLDDRVWELFLKLGEESGAGKDDGSEEGDDDMSDLLYLLVDSLTLSCPTATAYDEIEFDSWMAAARRAILVYRSEAEAICEPEFGAQRPTLVLVLEKRLHLVPWECMPCLQSVPVTRLPSLEALFSRLGLVEGSASASAACVRRRGAAILNPGKDLPASEAAISPYLAQLSPADWQRPAAVEADIVAALGAEEVDIFLYFGHGSGAQYVRPRAVRAVAFSGMAEGESEGEGAGTGAGESGRVARPCAAAFLMGCSSAALETHGPGAAFGPSGMALAYLNAGAPAVVGALWDVTDRDCDRFAIRCGGYWGLWDVPARLEGEPVGKGTRGAPAAAGAGDATGQVHLAEAVRMARKACYLRYLNGAAMVVYGVPVRIGG